MDTAQPTAGLTESYARWRSSRLGQITDTLEQQLLSELLGSVAGKTLLDVGCGDGAFASELARHGAIVTGLDADPAMIAAALKRSEIEATQIQLIEGQAETLPFRAGAFDYTLAVTTLCFVQDARQAIAEMARVLKPGGGWSSANLDAGAYGQASAVFEAGLVIRPGERQCFGRLRNFKYWLRPQGSA